MQEGKILQHFGWKNSLQSNGKERKGEREWFMIEKGATSLPTLKHFTRDSRFVPRMMQSVS